MSCVYPVPDESRSAAEILAGYRRVGKMLRGIPSKPQAVCFIPPVLPPYLKTTVEEERRFMTEAHMMLDLLVRPIAAKSVMTDDEKLEISAIYAAVSEVGRCTIAEIKSPRRMRQLVVARLMFYYLASLHTKLSYPAIGRLVGGRDHSTIIHGVETVKTALALGKEPYTSFYIRTMSFLRG